MKVVQSMTETWKAALKRVNLYSDRFSYYSRTSKVAMLTRIWSLPLTLIAISGLLSAMAVPSAYADDNEESMESIWADESQPSQGQPIQGKDSGAKAKAPVQVQVNRETIATPDAPPAKPVDTKKATAVSEQVKDLKPQVPTEVTRIPVSEDAPNSTSQQGQPEPVSSPTKQITETIEPTTPPAIFMPTTPAKSETAKPIEPTSKEAQPNLQGDLTEIPADKTQASTAAPLVKLDEFSNSHFIKQGGWPGIGPFRRQAGLDDVFVDQSGNSLGLHVTSGRVSQATFNLINKTATYDDFLDLQVASEFLLEGLNVKPKTIMEFNQQLEEAKDSLLNQSAAAPVTINAGRYIATINKDTNNQDEGKFSFVLSIVSRDANPDVIKEHSKEIANSILNLKKQNSDFIIRQNTTQESEPSPVKTSSNNLNETFSKAIQNWQDIKKIAVRQRKTEDLAQVLAGRALIRQTEAIKWLSNNHKYYDMTPKGISVERFNEITPGQKYAVFVEIKEVSKLMDDTNNQVIKETDDSYKVNYTVEKINGNWFITDSAFVDKSTTPSASRPQSKPNR